MKEIVNRLHEQRQVELAKSILESAGYKVEYRGAHRDEEYHDHPGWEFISPNSNPKHPPFYDPDGYYKEYKDCLLEIYPPQKMNYTNRGSSYEYAEGYEVNLNSRKYPDIETYYEESKVFDTFDEAEKYLTDIVDRYMTELSNKID